NKHLGAQLGGALDDVAAPLVRARHAVAEVQEDLGDAGHAAAADPHEVDLLVALIHWRAARCSRALPSRASSRAARSRRTRRTAAAGPSSARARVRPPGSRPQ